MLPSASETNPGGDGVPHSAEELAGSSARKDAAAETPCEPLNREDFDCPVCHDLLCQPCVPPCGHAFCRSCLCDLLQHAALHPSSGGAKCPVCRRVLHVTRPDNLLVCREFDRLLQHSFPAEYSARKALAAPATPFALSDSAALERLPIFVLDATMPNQRLHLHVFEPRYIIMVRRAMESGSRRIGMTWSDTASRGVEVEMLCVSEQWDGTYNVSVVGRRPFKVANAAVAPEGFLEGDVEYFDMDMGTDEGNTVDAVGQAAQELLPLLQSWENTVVDSGWQARPGHLALIKEQLGPMPAAVDRPGALAAWIVALVNPLPAMGVAPEMRPALLSANSPAERVAVAKQSLEASISYMESINNSILVKACRLIPASVRPFLPMLLVVGVGLVTSKVVGVAPPQ